MGAIAVQERAVAGTLFGSGAGTERPAGTASETSVLVPFDTTQVTSKANRSNPKAGGPSHPLAAGAHPPAVAFSSKDHGADAGDTPPARREAEPAHPPTVRRLTPREAERLQGFPDDYTKIPWRGKPASKCPDGPRYRALGNSMAVNVMSWIGQRIQVVDELLAALKEEAA